MATAIRRWHMRRQLRGSLEDGEGVKVIERLATGGWWVLTDRTLFSIDSEGTKAVSLNQMRTVQVKPATYQSVTILTGASNVIIGDLPYGSAIAERLQHMRVGPNGDGSSASSHP